MEVTLFSRAFISNFDKKVSLHFNNDPFRNSCHVRRSFGKTIENNTFDESDLLAFNLRKMVSVICPGIWCYFSSIPHQEIDLINTPTLF